LNDRPRATWGNIVEPIKQLKAELEQALADVNSMRELHGTTCVQLAQAQADFADQEKRADETMLERDIAQRECDRLQEELESHAWGISPGMAQAKIDELNRDNERMSWVLDRLAGNIVRIFPDISGEWLLMINDAVLFRGSNKREVIDRARGAIALAATKPESIKINLGWKPTKP
jgi:hypothetical protein